MFDIAGINDEDQEQLRRRGYDIGAHPHVEMAGPGAARPAADLGAIEVPKKDSTQQSAVSTQPRASMGGTDGTETVARGTNGQGGQSGPGGRSGSAAAPAMAGPNDSQLAIDQKRFNDLKNQGSPISRIHNPFLRGLAHVGDALGTAFLPGYVAAPWTETTHRMKLGQAEHAVAGDINTQKEQAQTEQEQAKATQERAKAESLLHPSAEHKVTYEKTADGHIVALRTDPDTGEITAQVVYKGNAADPKDAFQLWHQQNPQGRVEDFLKMQGENKTHTPEEQYIEDFQKRNPGSTLQDAMRAYAADTQKPMRINFGAQNDKANARSDKSYQYNSGQLEKLGQPLEQAVARTGRLLETLNQGTPQADAVVAPELLTIMAGGAGSGLRMNEAEIARIVGGRSKWESLRAAMQQWSTDPSKANSITDEQRKQIRALVEAVHGKLLKKMQVMDAAHDALLNSDDPKDHRKTVVDARKRLTQIDEGNEAAGGQIEVKAPNGKSYFFPDQAAADAFKQKANIK